MSQINRRKFLEILGKAGAFAALTSCKVDRITYKALPHLIKEDETPPFEPEYIKTTCLECPAACPLEVKIVNKKPLKIKADTGVCIRGEASIVNLYNPDRIKIPLLKKDGKFIETDWETALNILNQKIKEAKNKLFITGKRTGSLVELLKIFSNRLDFNVKQFEVLNYGALRKVSYELFGIHDIPDFIIDEADLLITIGADIIETFGNPVVNANRLAKFKKAGGRWIHIEEDLSLTGLNSKRYIYSLQTAEDLISYLISKINAPYELKTRLKYNYKPEFEEILNEVKKSKKPLFICGPGFNSYKIWYLTMMLNYYLGAINTRIKYYRFSYYGNVSTYLDFNDKNLDLLFVLNKDLYNELPANLNSNAYINSVFKAGAFMFMNETAKNFDLILPLSHNMESWGDEFVNKGASIVREVISPQGTKSEGELICSILNLNGMDINFNEFLYTRWQSYDPEKFLSEGLYKFNVYRDVKLNFKTPKLETFINSSINVKPDLRFYDGRSRIIHLLNEIPDPVTGASYGNFIVVPAKYNLEEFDMVELFNTRFSILKDDKTQKPYTYISMLKVKNMEFDEYTGELIYSIEHEIKKSGKLKIPVLRGAKYAGERNILKENEYKKATLYKKHEHKNYRWAMAINLDLCTGCSACVASCYIENNVPVVGPLDHIEGREMSWIRIERYDDRGELIPMLCQQCDNAPCESVCPVFATYHNPQGLNAQIYNRCVGTRYCSNNCPYMVRRFNWKNNKNKLPLYTTSNPAVSIRAMGVMEKCTFCVQRIRYMEDRAKDENRQIRDGEVMPACMEACAYKAIEFGNILDENSNVYKLSRKAERILEELGVEPSVYYIRNA